MNSSRWSMTCVVAAVVIGGVTASPTGSADPAAGSVVTLQQLLSAPVPALCEHDPGNLVNGTLPQQESHRGHVGIARRYDEPGEPYKVAFGNLTGADNIDAAMVTDCSAGGVPWPETVQLYTAGPTRLGGVDLGDITHSREVVSDLSISDGVVHVHWLANGPNDGECCPSIQMAADLRWDGLTVRAENVRRLN
ncbi:hypothetical protein [Mycolicibacterium sp.]|uniref:hypothetical protein n=1 Tax=Mycolicibacterium sp. TaxID=2320850 RepID=UPI0037CC8AE3